MSDTIFFEDFDGTGAGFDGPVFESWSIGGIPVDWGHWGLFYPDMNPVPNLTPGSGRYAGVHSESHMLLDSLVWLISPLIDARKYRKLALSTDVYFKSRGAEPGEDTVNILILQVGKEPQTIGVIGNTMSCTDAPISQNMSWNIPFSQCGVIQVAFTWYSSMGPPKHDSIQLDNIHLTGRRAWACWFFSFLRS